MSTNPPAHGTDLFGFTTNSLDQQITQYISGTQSSPAIMNGVMAAAAPLCVTACNLSGNALSALEHYVERPGAKLLVDSGAFLYRDNPQDMPWQRVINTYRRLSQCCSRDARIDFVLPDVVGDQEGTTQVLARWGAQCVEAAGDSARCLLTLQDGALSPVTFVRHSEKALGLPIRSIALPCKVARMPAQKLHALRELTLDRVHLLGTSYNTHLARERVVVLTSALPGVTITCDSTAFRAQIGKGKPITEMRRVYQHQAMMDSGEVFENLECDGELKTAVLERVCQKDPNVAVWIDTQTPEEFEDNPEEPHWTMICDDQVLLECYLEVTQMDQCADPQSTRNAVADWALEQVTQNPHW